MRSVLALAAVLAVVAPVVRAETYEIDSVHSQVGFRIKHLVGKVPGRFAKFAGTIDFTPGKPESWKVDATIDPASINTDNDKRDAHLKSADFFDVAKFPAMTFKSTKVTDLKGGTAKLHGDLTMRGVTKAVVLDLEIGGVAKDPWGNSRAGFTAAGTINRKDFGIVWNKTLDAGGLMLGEDVAISLDVEAVAKPKDAPKK
ncbi:MAG: YceI family protein [Elusimicrobia bacterium]|nr:YceI family protein [Elusimicrobiota bacterium]